MKDGDLILLEDILPRDHLSNYKHDLCGHLYKVVLVGEDITQLLPLFHSVRKLNFGSERLLIYNSALVATVVETEKL